MSKYDHNEIKYSYQKVLAFTKHGIRNIGDFSNGQGYILGYKQPKITSALQDSLYMARMTAISMVRQDINAIDNAIIN